MSHRARDHVGRRSARRVYLWQRWSPQLLGRGDTATFSALFQPRLTPEHLAPIVRQALSEPEDPGQPGPPSWAEGLVADPTAVNWPANLE